MHAVYALLTMMSFLIFILPFQLFILVLFRFLLLLLNDFLLRDLLWRICPLLLFVILLLILLSLKSIHRNLFLMFQSIAGDVLFSFLLRSIQLATLVLITFALRGLSSFIMFQPRNKLLFTVSGMSDQVLHSAPGRVPDDYKRKASRPLPGLAKAPSNLGGGGGRLSQGPWLQRLPRASGPSKE
jgi:hypothetical protein